MRDFEQVTDLWSDYQDGLDYQSRSGLSHRIPEYVKFYEGDQWPRAGSLTRNMPRPTTNIIKMICRNKIAGILSSKVRITYRSDDTSVDTDRFNDFALYIQKEIGQEVLDQKAIKDAAVKGTYIYHYYWDAEARGKDGLVEGGLRCETLDPLRVFFANPAEADEQKQKWILICSREDVESVRAKADRGVDKETITADEDDNNKYNAVESQKNKLCTVLTRYFRKNGEVWCERGTKSVMVNQPFAITPDLEAARKEISPDDRDAPNNSLPDPGDTDSQETVPKVGCYLYPIVVGSYEQKERSIYGISEVEGLIPNQKAINFILAMQIMAVQETSWGKYVVLENALRNQKITNEPGQVLTDYTGTGNGIRRLGEQSLSTAPINLIEEIMSTTRSVSGSTEVMTGETIKSGMSGAAIANLQSQAQMPTQVLRDAFWRVKEKQGKVMAQFFRLFYEGKRYNYKTEKPVMGENCPLMDPMGRQVTEEVYQSAIFNSSDYEHINFDCVCEATAGAVSSAAGDINILDQLFQSGKISTEAYIKAYPDEALANKSEILRQLEADKNDQLASIKQTLVQTQEQLARAVEVVQRQSEEIDKINTVVTENRRLKELLATMADDDSRATLGLVDTIRKIYDEAKTKIQTANAQIEAGNEALRAYSSAAETFAGELMDRMGGERHAVPDMPS